MKNKTVVEVCGVVSVAAVVPVFPGGTYRHHRGITTVPHTLNGTGRPHLPQNSTRDAFSDRDARSSTAGKGARLKVFELPNTFDARSTKTTDDVKRGLL